MAIVLLILASLAIGGAVFMITVGLAQFFRENAAQLVAGQEAESQRELEALFIRDVSARQVTTYTLVGALAALVVVYGVTGALLPALVFAAGVYFLPRAIFSYLRSQRLAQFNEELPDSLTVLANSTRAGLSLQQSVEEITRQVRGPVADEMSLVLQEVRLGNDLQNAIDNARHRIGSRNFGLVATALQVNREKGGNLPEALDRMNEALKEIWRLEQRLVTASSEGRKAVWWISAVPLFVFLLFAAFDPSLPAKLIGSVAGLVILFLAIILYGAGVYWLMQILRTDV